MIDHDNILTTVEHIGTTSTDSVQVLGARLGLCGAAHGSLRHLRVTARLTRCCLTHAAGLLERRSEVPEADAVDVLTLQC